MNRDDAFKILWATFKSYWVCKALCSDLIACISGSGWEKQFFNLLLTRLKYLKEHGVHATKHKEFELLGETNGLYSMHLFGKGFNIRILYAFAPNNRPVLLLGFFERSGKKKTDYTQYITLAQQRLAEELGGINHG